MDVKIVFTVCCPTCGNMDVPDNKRRGLIINRRATIGSDMVMIKNQISRLDPKKEPAQIILLQDRLVKLQKEFNELEASV